MLRLPRTFFRASLTAHTPETCPNSLANRNLRSDKTLQTHGIVYHLGASLLYCGSIHLAFSTRTNRARPHKCGTFIKHYNVDEENERGLVPVGPKQGGSIEVKCRGSVRVAIVRSIGERMKDAFLVV